MTEFVGYTSNHNFNNGQKSFFNKIEKEINRPLVLISGLTDNIDYYLPPDDALVVYDFKCPQGFIHGPTEKYHIQGPIKKVALEKHTWAYRFGMAVPKHWGQRFRFENREFIVAVYKYNEVYTSIPLINFTKQQLEDCNFKQLFKGASDKETYDKIKNKELDEMLKKASEEFETASLNEQQDIRQRIDQFHNELSQQMAASIRITKQIRKEGSRLKLSQSSQKEEATRILDQLKELQKNVYVLRLSFSGGTLVIETDKMYLYSPSGKERVYLGEMRIQISTNGSILISNLSNSKGEPAKPHPHVSNTGDACWGGIQAQITKLVSNFELVGLLETIFSYLENYNPDDDYGRYAPYWFDTQPIQYLQDDGSFLTKEEVEDKVEKIKEKAQPDAPATTTSI